jgi:hypothetical protein
LLCYDFLRARAKEGTGVAACPAGDEEEEDKLQLVSTDLAINLSLIVTTSN